MMSDVFRRVRGAMVFALVLVLACVAAPAFAQSPPPAPPDYGFTWSTISHPGNRPANQTEAPILFPPFTTPAMHVGAVDHEYRIATTEVSVADWFEFVQAYQPYYRGSPADNTFTSFWIDYNSSSRTYFIQEGAANRPAGMAWRFAARYVNWLHNDKRLEQAAFETGVYDTSTFFTNPDGTFTDQREHSPGARFWIPTLDEWTKAVYYDPNRYGEGQEGYWRYPNGTNTSLITGYPEDGGETSAGLSVSDPDARWLDIGSYPHVQTPWGLLDASGGVGEWTEYITPDMTSRATRGSAQFSGSPDLFDRVDFPNALRPDFGVFVGLRLASSVPCPCVLPGLALCSWFLLTGRKRS